MTMKALRAENGALFGPCWAISEETDHFDADGAIYPKTVVGNAVIEDWTPPPPAPPPVPVPPKITNAQARYVLRRTPYNEETLFDAVNRAAQMQGGDILDFWEYANEFYRDSPAILGLALALGISAAQLDDLFRTAEEVQL
jgi:hypothetical protein